MIYQHISLRGWTGIQKGMGVDEIQIDFTQIPSGIVAISGENGRGKSTLLENMLPYRTLVTRSGALKDHVGLRDSHRIIKFTYGGDQYESKILIDAQNGKQEAYLFRNGVPMNDGKTGTYDAAIESVLGSKDLFCESMFRGQNTPAFSSLPESERKSLFVELLGLQRLETYRETAKTRSADQKMQLDAFTAKRQVLQDDAAKLPGYADALGEAKASMKAVETDIFVIKEVIAKVEKNLAEARAQKAQEDEYRRQRLDLNEQIEKAKQDHATAVNELKTEKQSLITQSAADEHEKLQHQAAIKAGESAWEITGEIGLLKAKIGVYDAVKEQHDALRAKLHETQERRREEYRAKKDELKDAERKESDYGRDLVALELERDNIINARDAKLADLEKQIAILPTVPCADSLPDEQRNTCQFLQNAVSAQVELDNFTWDSSRETELRTKISDIDTELEKTERLVGELKAELEEITKAGNEEILSINNQIDTLSYSEEDYLKAKSELAEAEKKNPDVLLERAKNATVNLERCERQINERTKRIEEIDTKIDTLTKSVTAKISNLQTKVEEISAKITGAGKKVEEFEAGLAVQQTELALAEQKQEPIRQQIAAAEVAIANCHEKSKQAEALGSDISAVQREYEDWELIVRGTGRDAIQALEIDAAGPEIAGIANDLLQETFGSKFQIQIVTTRPSADGKRDLECFDVMVFNNGDRQSISTLSGGEKVCIEEGALLQAISLYRRSRSKKPLQTMFLDEADGDLSQANAENYLRMIENAHKSGHTNHTFFITHRPELLLHINNIIRLDEGGISVTY